MNDLRGKKVLIVDDEPDLREIMVEFFALRGCKVYQAENGRSAFQMHSSENVDIVLSDVRMPDGDGMELLTSLRGLHPRMPIVFLITGYADYEADEVRRRGGAGLLNKPFKLTELEKHIVQHLKTIP